MKMEGRQNYAKQYDEDKEYWENRAFPYGGVLWNSVTQSGHVRNQEMTQEKYLTKISLH